MTLWLRKLRAWWWLKRHPLTRHAIYRRRFARAMRCFSKHVAEYVYREEQTEDGGIYYGYPR